MNDEIETYDLTTEVVEEMAEILRDFLDDDREIDRILEICNLPQTQANVSRVKKIIVNGIQAVRDLV